MTPIENMKAQEIKAELDMREISYVGCYDKTDLVNLLAEARATGKCDPSVLTEFNRQMAERMTGSTEQVSIEEGDLEGLDHLIMLIDPYHPKFFYFEIVECVRKMLLIGVTVFIERGSFTQMVLAQIVAVISFGLYAATQPYADPLDNYLMTYYERVGTDDTLHITIKTFTEDFLKSDELIEISAEQFPQLVRMAHAITYHNSQSKTLPGTVGLFETQSIYFSERHLLVGLSRATQCSDVMIYS